MTVRVRGPKGAFNVEMQRDKTQDRTIHCKYEPREPGDYQVEVKWHGHHVPGKYLSYNVLYFNINLFSRFSLLRHDCGHRRRVKEVPGW